MKSRSIPLNKCLYFKDGRVALGINGHFRPVAVNIMRADDDGEKEDE